MRLLVIILLFSVKAIAQPVAATILMSHRFAHVYMLSIDYTQCGSSSSTNFPVLVSLTSTALKTVANGGNVVNTVTFNGQTVPADLCFAMSANFATLLSWDIEFYDASAGTIKAWVNIATVSNTVNTVFYMGVGSTITTYQGGAVGAAWNSNYKGVWHLQNGTTLSALDATSNANNGTINGVTAATGNIDGGGNFTRASSQYIGCGTSTSLNASTAVTLSAWIKTASNANYLDILSKRTSGGAVNYQIAMDAAGKVEWWNGSGGLINPTVLSTGTWYHVVATNTNSSNTLNFYINGSITTTNGSPALGSTNTGNLTIGRNGDGAGEYFDGVIDEPRVMTSVISADWITTEYNSQKSGSTFLTTTQLY